jgi:hypothetical protein
VPSAPGYRNGQWLRPSTPLRKLPTRWPHLPPAVAACGIAYEASIYLIRVRPEDIPDEDLRRTFIGVMDDDLSYAQLQGDEGRILATLRLTNDDDARAIARRILDLHRELDRFLK